MHVQPDLKVYGNVAMTDDQMSELGVQLKIYKDYAYYYHEGELGVRALEAWKYYYGELPMPITKGSSKWVDRSVWESVNGSLQELISVFTSGEDAVRFIPRSNQDALSAEAATKLVNKVLLVENNGYRTFHDSFKEACIVRNSWIKRYWKEGMETVTENFEDIQKDAIDMYLNDLEGELVALSVEEDAETGLCSGAITYEKHFEGVKVEYVPFEQVIIEPTATCIADTNYLAHRVRKTKDELLELGFPPEVVKGLQSNTPTIESGVITSARVDNLNPVTITSTVSVGDERTDHVWLYENYIKTSVLTGTVELLQVFTVNEQILEVNRVNDIPFETFTPFPIPGAVFGESVTDITKDIQELNTALVRGIIDNTMNANFGRYTALKGAYDRRSLLDNRPGGVVEITTPGAINPYPYHPLPQGSMALLEYVEQKKEQRTGVTRLGMGLTN